MRITLIYVLQISFISSWYDPTLFLILIYIHITYPRVISFRVVALSIHVVEPNHSNHYKKEVQTYPRSILGLWFILRPLTTDFHQYIVGPWKLRADKDTLLSWFTLWHLKNCSTFIFQYKYSSNVLFHKMGKILP